MRALIRRLAPIAAVVLMPPHAVLGQSTSSSGASKEAALSRVVQAQLHLQASPHATRNPDGTTLIAYDMADGRRLATSRIAVDGRLLQFSVNSADDRRKYRPFPDRRVLIRRLMLMVSPDAPAAEVEWAERQLDDPAREWTPSFPIIVGGFVYRLHRAAMHDHLEISAADAATPGWRFPKARP